MVVYDLICKKRHRFEGWFPSFEGYREQAEKGQISCPSCGATEVEKMPHACAVLMKKEKSREEAPRRKGSAPPLTEARAKELLLRLHHYIQENFENVGPRFAEEARAILDSRTEERPIHGTATPEEREELDDEGIPYATLPKPTLDS